MIADVCVVALVCTIIESLGITGLQNQPFLLSSVEPDSRPLIRGDANGSLWFRRFSQSQALSVSLACPFSSAS